jgi:hypothetical protein
LIYNSRSVIPIGIDSADLLVASKHLHARLGPTSKGSKIGEGRVVVKVIVPKVEIHIVVALGLPPKKHKPGVSRRGDSNLFARCTRTRHQLIRILAVALRVVVVPLAALYARVDL